MIVTKAFIKMKTPVGRVIPEGVLRWYFSSLIRSWQSRRAGVVRDRRGWETHRGERPGQQEATGDPRPPAAGHPHPADHSEALWKGPVRRVC